MSDVSTRLAALRTQMAETGTDLVALGPTSHMQWLAGVSPHGDERPVFLLVSRSEVAFLMPQLNADSVRQDTDLPFFCWADAKGPETTLASLLAHMKLDTQTPHISLDEAMRADFALLLLDALPGARRSFASATVGALRARKDAGEYAILKANALVNDIAMRSAFAALKVGVTEREVAAIVRETYKTYGAVGEFTLICFGENGAFPHHHSGERALRSGDAVLVDIGGRSRGYPSDMTRSGSFGPPPEELEKVHGVVEAAVQAALSAARPGVKASVVDMAARDVITAAGYGENFLHRTGHGLGIDIHEPPYITAVADTVLETGHVFSIEPGIYLPGRFGVRLEEIVILREDGPEILSELPRAAVRIDA